MPDDERYLDVLIVGGGPAGMSAARTAAGVGMRVLLVDERPTLGGQIYKQPGPGFSVTDPAAADHSTRYGRQLIESAVGSDAAVALRTAVVAVEQQDDGFAVVLVRDGEPATTVRTHRLILAPGAHDRPVAFPGWTLPGVVTAGAMQSMAKSQAVLPGRRMVFAGSGPVALAFPSQLAHYGARVVTALEAGPAPRPLDLARILGAARGNGSLLRDAARYRAGLLRHRVPVRYGRIVVRAEGGDRVERVVHAAVDRDWQVIPGSELTVEADVLCIGYGFVPSLELLRLVGCSTVFDDDLGGRVVQKDDWGRTSTEGVYAAGDGTGVEGSYVAIDEGVLAALGAAQDAGFLDRASAEHHSANPRRRLRRRRSLARATGRMFRVGTGIYDLADDQTTVCRCENVTQASLVEASASTDDLNVVKGLTRAGMGPCQGRNCQRHIAALLARTHGVPIGEIELATPRMPVRPVPIAAMADATVSDPGLFVVAEEERQC
jgi:NADPH-dependent 2,4-dienoyl-CoA reductase/sulfur reductase-like enzyme